jgi:hypothetical protein
VRDVAGLAAAAAVERAGLDVGLAIRGEVSVTFAFALDARDSAAAVFAEAALAVCPESAASADLAAAAASATVHVDLLAISDAVVATRFSADRVFANRASTIRLRIALA